MKAGSAPAITASASPLAGASGRQAVAAFLEGASPGPDAAITKLYWSEYHKVLTELSLDIIGAEAMTPSGKTPSSAFSTDAAGGADAWDAILHTSVPPAEMGGWYAAADIVLNTSHGEGGSNAILEAMAPEAASSARSSPQPSAPSSCFSSSDY